MDTLSLYQINKMVREIPYLSEFLRRERKLCFFCELLHKVQKDNLEHKLSRIYHYTKLSQFRDVMFSAFDNTKLTGYELKEYNYITQEYTKFINLYAVRLNLFQIAIQF